uniref:ATP synthase F0 subunit 8 n=1 Tax=Midoria longicornis TaxID=3133673 RepID=A0AAU6PC64_9HEMI
MPQMSPLWWLFLFVFFLFSLFIMLCFIYFLPFYFSSGKLFLKLNNYNWMW